MIARLTHGGHTGDEIALQTMKAAYDGGVNFFDSAEAYAAGRAEILLGKAVKHFKSVIFGHVRSV